MQAMAETFTVMTFNLRKDSWLDRSNRWNYRKYMIADFIRRSEATIIGVQELMPKMKQDIKEYLQGYSIFGKGRSRHLFNEHSDIIVNNHDVNVQHSQTFWLSKRPEKLGSRAFLSFFPRICTICEVRFKENGKSVRVFNAHFDHISGIARRIGMEMILKYMDELQKKEPMPQVLMGDFNVRPNNKLIRQLTQHQHRYQNIRLVDAYGRVNGKYENLNTYHGFKGKVNGKAHLDYIFVSDDLEIVNSYVDHSHCDGKFLSDHFPIVTTLQFKQCAVAR